VSVYGSDTFLSRRSAVRLGSAGLAAALGTSTARSAQASELQTLEANKALIHRLFEVGVNIGDEALTTSMYSPDYVDRGSWLRQMPGPAGMPIPLHEFRAEFPDVTVTLDSVIAEADFVATHESWRGTHPPAGTHLVGRTMHLFRITKGQIVDQWSVGWEWLTHRAYRPETQPINPLTAP
jgi:predicted SnoaL-like aldol condensation-catalyzing enzyme